MFVIAQAHRSRYPKSTIEAELLGISPDAIIPENVAPIIVGYEEQINLNNDVLHQFEVAIKLGVPVILPDIVQDNLLLVGSPQNLQIVDEKRLMNKVNEFGVVVCGELSLAGAMLFSSLISDVISKNKAGSSESKGWSRRKFLGFSAFLGLATLPILLRKQAGELLMDEFESSYSQTGPVEPSSVKAISYQLPQTIFFCGLDNEKMFPLIFALRESKFIATAESVSSLLQKRGINDPKLAIVVGLLHLDSLRANGHHQRKERIATAGKITNEVFLPVYRGVLDFYQSFGFSSESELLKYTVLDLLRISLSAYVSGFEDQGESLGLKWQGYIFLEDIIEGVIGGLKDEPMLLSGYQKGLEKLRQYELLK